MKKKVLLDIIDKVIDYIDKIPGPHGLLPGDIVYQVECGEYVRYIVTYDFEDKLEVLDPSVSKVNKIGRYRILYNWILPTEVPEKVHVEGFYKADYG